MAETAVTISFALLCLYGGMELALLGYDQLQLDGGTFFLTHAYAGQLSSNAANISSLDSTLAPLFPNVTLSAASFTLQTPPNTTVSPNFTQWGTTSSRFGGVSLVRPERLQASVSQTITPTGQRSSWNPFRGSGSGIPLTAGNVDARSVVTNAGYDASGDDFNSTATFKDPLVEDEQNVPPYYVAQVYMWYCTPWVKYNKGVGNQRKNGEVNCGDAVLASLGLAEFLKSDNYNNSANGIDTNGVFTLVKCHQLMFANIAYELSNNLGGANRPNQGTWNNSNMNTYMSTMDSVADGTYGSTWDMAPVPTYAVAIPPTADLTPSAGC